MITSKLVYFKQKFCFYNLYVILILDLKKRGLALLHEISRSLSAMLQWVQMDDPANSVIMYIQCFLNTTDQENTKLS